MRLCTPFSAVLAIAAAFPSTIPTAAAQDSGAVWATPHDSYSSSVGVLGCKIDTDRVAYWPGSVDCTNLCVELSYEGRSVKLLRIDQSGGAHDVSYDAWNYLYTGYSATKKPTTGGAIPMNYKNLPASACAPLLKTEGKKLPLSAANSMNFIASCLAQPNSWVAKNYLLYNILDSVCTWGVDEKCTLDWPTANQASCKNALGAPVPLSSDPVLNVQYGTGKLVKASSGVEAPAQATQNAKVGMSARTSSLSTGMLRYLFGIIAVYSIWWWV